MIGITDYAKRLETFCQNNVMIEKFKIYVRLNFSVDVYILISNGSEYTVARFLSEFKESLPVDQRDSIGNVKLWRVRVEMHSLSDLAADPLLFDLFQVSENDIEYGPRLRFNGLLNGKKEDVSIQNEIPIVTFYSYKGGMGRTTTMMSYALDLALNHNKKVFIIDCDLEAPGYLNFFDLSKHVGLTSGRVNGLVEFLSDIQFSKNHDSVDLDNYFINLLDGNENESKVDGLSNIYIMPAGNLNENYDDDLNINRLHYLEGLSRLNLANEKSILSGLQILFSKVQQQIRPDIILIDSRTGFNDIIGIISLYLSKMIVGFFGYNEQTVPGLLSLIDSYYHNDYKLAIVSSILPVDIKSELITNEKARISNYIALRYGNGEESSIKKDLPHFLELHRNALLETLGSSDADSVEEYVKFVKNGVFGDYKSIFEEINTCIFDGFSIVEEPSNDNQSKSYSSISANTPAINLRNIVLRGLKETLSPIASFAEATSVNESIFFYRKCMNELFDEKKFIIQGYKGTGKTYLYKSLADPNQTMIAKRIRERANEQRALDHRPPFDPACRLKFIDIISYEENGNKLFDFKGMSFRSIAEPEFFFNCFWQIHTWNSILLDPEFSSIREASSLKHEIKDIRGNEAILRFKRLIDQGIEVLITIEEDFQKLNEYLVSHNIKLFLLYDQLDTRINPIHWSKAVSPLISYWREKWSEYPNILPKIFVRTDLRKRIQGTNTERLKDNIISIEWSIEEIFAYFFKLIFSKQQSAEAFLAIAEHKIHLDKQYLDDIKRQFANNDNQFKPLDRAQIGPFVNVFFGKEVIVNGTRLGNPWDYFFLNLTNADNFSISMRPFINMLNKNAIDLGLKKTERYVTQLLSPEIYASREVRLKTAVSYFEDLTYDEFNQDLIKVKEFINSDRGQDFRFKTLKESQFNSMINSIFNEGVNEGFKVVQTPDDLKDLLYANGIMVEKITRGGKVYRFATMYAYAWALKSTEFDKNEDAAIQKESFGPMKRRGTYDSRKRVVLDHFGRRYAVENIIGMVRDGEEVEFTVYEVPHPDGTEGKIFRKAKDITTDF